MATNASPDDNTALERLTRMFGMGEYGERLAQEILDQYLTEYFEVLSGPAFPAPHDDDCLTCGIKGCDYEY